MENIVLMRFGANGQCGPSQVHLSDGRMLRPVLTASANGNVETVYAVPCQFKAQLEAAGFETILEARHHIKTGPTNSRPTKPNPYYTYFDTEIYKYICWDGVEWVDLQTGAAV